MEVDTVGMTNRQWQGWLRTIIKLVRRMLKDPQPNNEDLKELLELFQEMLEDGTE